MIALKDGSIVVSDDDGYIIIFKPEKKENKLILKQISKTLIGDTGHLIAEIENDDEISDLIITTFGDIEKYAIKEEGKINKPTFFDVKVLTYDRV